MLPDLEAHDPPILPPRLFFHSPPILLTTPKLPASRISLAICSSSALCVRLASSKSLKLLPMLGVPSLPSRAMRRVRGESADSGPIGDVIPGPGEERVLDWVFEAGKAEDREDDEECAVLVEDCGCARLAAFGCDCGFVLVVRIVEGGSLRVVFEGRRRSVALGS